MPTEPSQQPTNPEPTAPTPEPSLIPETKVEEQPKEEAPKEKPAAEFVPLTVADLKLPEGAQVDDKGMEEFLGIVNNQELTPAARAQALIDLQAKLSQAASETGSQAWADLQTRWQDEVRADPEIGGAKLGDVLTGIGKVVDQYGSPELRQMLSETGAGNSIHMIRFLHKIVPLVSEGTPVSGQPAVTEESMAQKMFPSMKKA